MKKMIIKKRFNQINKKMINKQMRLLFNKNNQNNQNKQNNWNKILIIYKIKMRVTYYRKQIWKRKQMIFVLINRYNVILISI